MDHFLLFIFRICHAFLSVNLCGFIHIWRRETGLSPPVKYFY